jgi:hypothetical protein
MSPLDAFRATLTKPAPGLGSSLALQALWWDAKGDWDRAHECAQGDESAEAAWVHAYLHRKEGDAGNAAYWYRRAGQASAPDGFGAEWERIAAALLGGSVP